MITKLRYANRYQEDTVVKLIVAFKKIYFIINFHHFQIQLQVMKYAFLWNYQYYERTPFSSLWWKKSGW